VKKVKDGSGLMTGARESFGNVADSAGKVAELLAEIAAASKEQSQGIDQVNIAVGDVDKVTQQNAAYAEESSSAAVELSSQAGQMKVMVEDLLGLIGGQTQTAQQPRLERSKALVAGKPQTVPAATASVAAKPSAWKQPAPNPREQSPERIIPLDHEDFKDF